MSHHTIFSLCVKFKNNSMLPLQFPSYATVSYFFVTCVAWDYKKLPSYHWMKLRVIPAQRDKMWDSVKNKNALQLHLTVDMSVNVVSGGTKNIRTNFFKLTCFSIQPVDPTSGLRSIFFQFGYLQNLMLALIFLTILPILLWILPPIHLIKFKIFKFKILFDFIAPNHNIQLPQDAFVRSTTTVRVYFSLLQRHTSDSFFFVFGSAPMRAAFQLHSDTHSPLLAPASLNHKGKERELNN